MKICCRRDFCSLQGPKRSESDQASLPTTHFQLPRPFPDLDSKLQLQSVQRPPADRLGLAWW